MVAEQYEAARTMKPALTVSEAKARGAAGRWARHWAENEERDKQILTMYNEVRSLRQVADHFGLHRPTIRSIIHRLGGSTKTAQPTTS